MSKHLVFVYGTLRRGGLRSMPELFPGSKFVGDARAGGSLYDLGPHPFLLLEESGSSVVGEVYEVDGELLKRLDDVESSADYLRRQTEVSLGDRTATCWTYTPDADSFPDGVLIKSGDWVEYARAKTHRPDEN